MALMSLPLNPKTTLRSVLATAWSHGDLIIEPHYSKFPCLVLVALPLTVGTATPSFNCKGIAFF